MAMDSAELYQITSLRTAYEEGRQDAREEATED